MSLGREAQRASSFHGKRRGVHRSIIPGSACRNEPRCLSEANAQLRFHRMFGGASTGTDVELT